MEVVLNGDDMLKQISDLEVNNIVWVCNNPTDQETQITLNLKQGCDLSIFHTVPCDAYTPFSI